MKSINQYLIKKEIGRGGTSIVYLAHDPETGNDVAIKLLRESLSDNKKALERFEREAQIIMALEHPSIVPVLDFDSFEDRLFFVMPYLSGGALRQQIEQGPISIERTIAILEPITQALDTLHTNHIIHRDVKPHNILLDETGRAYLADFGVARILNADGQHTVTFVGTPEFIAPEQAVEGDLTPQTDIYQLGVTLFQMLTGVRPFTGTSLRVIMDHLNKPLPLAESINPSLPMGSDKIIQCAAAKDPAERYQSAGAMLADLQVLAGELSATQDFVYPVTAIAKDTANQSNRPRKKAKKNISSRQPIRFGFVLKAASLITAVGIIAGGAAFAFTNFNLANLAFSANQPAGEGVVDQGDTSFVSTAIDFITGNMNDDSDDDLDEVVVEEDAPEDEALTEDTTEDEVVVDNTVPDPADQTDNTQDDPPADDNNAGAPPPANAGAQPPPPPPNDGGGGGGGRGGNGGGGNGGPGGGGNGGPGGGGGGNGGPGGGGGGGN